MLEHKYPAGMSFAANGIRPFEFSEIKKFPTRSTVHYNPAETESVETQIAQFLSATRDIDLRRQKTKMRFDCKGKNKRKKSLRPKEWLRVSESLGPTGVLNLLYRKRIKANYQEIDTLQSDVIDSKTVISSLGRILCALNFVHEAFIAKAVGLEEYRKLVNGTKHRGAAVERVSLIENVLGAS
jgi:hypothetical protein